MNYLGVILGALSLIVIGVWHPIVIKGEYYLGKEKCTVIFAAIGLLCVIGSLFITNIVASAAIALFGFSAFWGIKEVHEQERRVEKGWFPKRDVGDKG